jgi:predicted nucleic acid-binding protein
MGSLSLPSSGLVYVDSVTVIYTVERFPKYWALLDPLWQAARQKTVEIVSSELTLMETLVRPLRNGDAALIQAFEQMIFGTDMRLIPISQPILREAARQRATTRLRTPDALQAATALLNGCALFVTNDLSFRGLSGLPLVILDDLLTP